MMIMGNIAGFRKICKNSFCTRNLIRLMSFEPHSKPENTHHDEKYSHPKQGQRLAPNREKAGTLEHDVFHNDNEPLGRQDIAEYLSGEHYLCETAASYDQAAEKIELYHYIKIVKEKSIAVC